jgi:hypothetical protein
VARSVNPTCPDSDDADTHAMEGNGIVYGFCSTTLADPGAWPKFIELVEKVAKKGYE